MTRHQARQDQHDEKRSKEYSQKKAKLAKHQDSDEQVSFVLLPHRNFSHSTARRQTLLKKLRNERGALKKQQTSERDKLLKQLQSDSSKLAKAIKAYDVFDCVSLFLYVCLIVTRRSNTKSTNGK